MKGHVTTFDSREGIMDDILKDDHFGWSILYYLGDILAVMTIWK